MAVLVNAAEVRGMLTTAEALRLAEQAYLVFGEERRVTSIPSAAFMLYPGTVPTSFWIKGAYSRTLGIAGVSVGAQFGEYYFMVNDGATGMLKGLVERAFMSKRRTGATAGVVARQLAAPGSRVAALIGAGQIGEQAVRAIAQALPLDGFRIASRTFEGAAAFVERLQPEMNVALSAVADAEAAVRGADIVVTITVAQAPFVRAGWLKPGALLISMGGVAEVGFEVLPEFDRVIVDDLDYALLRGDFAAWIKGGHIARDMLAARVNADIGEVVCGAKPGRSAPQERILAIIQGMTICDLVTANWIVETAAERGLGARWEVQRQLEKPAAEALQRNMQTIVSGLSSSA